MIIKVQKRALLGCLIIALLLGACTSPRVEQTQPAPVTLKVVILPYLSEAPLFIAEEGYFAEQALDIEFVELKRSAEAVPALAQGDLDVIAGASAPAC